MVAKEGRDVRPGCLLCPLTATAIDHMGALLKMRRYRSMLKRVMLGQPNMTRQSKMPFVRASEPSGPINDAPPSIWNKCAT